MKDKRKRRKSFDFHLEVYYNDSMLSCPNQPINGICFKGLYICFAANLCIISELYPKKAEIFIY